MITALEQHVAKCVLGSALPECIRSSSSHRLFAMWDIGLSSSDATVPKYAKHVEVHWSWIAFAISCFELNIRSLKTWTLEERSQYLENQGIVTAKQECSMPFPDWVVFCMLLLCCVSHFAGWNSFTRTKRYWHFCQNFWWNALCPLHGSFVEMSRMLSSSGIRTQMKLPGCLDRSLTRSTENTRK